MHTNCQIEVAQLILPRRREENKNKFPEEKQK